MAHLYHQCVIHWLFPNIFESVLSAFNRKWPETKNFKRADVDFGSNTANTAVLSVRLKIVTGAKQKLRYNVLHPVKVTAKVWYLVDIDLIDASRASAKGNRYLLTQTDYFSKYVEAILLPDKSALSVAKGLL